MPYDPMRTKFRQSKDYTHEMLVRDLIQYSEELSAILGGFDARLLPVEGAVNSLDTRVDALEALNLGPRVTALEGRATALENADIALDARLDTIEAWKATAITQILGLQNADIALDARLDTLEAMFETNTWIPSVTFAGGSVGMTYTATPYARFGKYTRIGKLVLYNYSFQLSLRGSSTGIAKISGLPATLFAGVSTGNPGPSWLSYWGSMVNTANYFGFNAMCWDTPGSINLYENASGSGNSATHANFTNSSFMVGGGMYLMP